MLLVREPYRLRARRVRVDPHSSRTAARYFTLLRIVSRRFPAAASVSTTSRPRQTSTSSTGTAPMMFVTRRSATRCSTRVDSADVDPARAPAVARVGDGLDGARAVEQRQVRHAQARELAGDPVAAQLRLAHRREAAGVAVRALAAADLNMTRKRVEPSFAGRRTIQALAIREPPPVVGLRGLGEEPARLPRLALGELPRRRASPIQRATVSAGVPESTASVFRGISPKCTASA